MSVFIKKYPLKIQPKQILKLESGAIILPGICNRWGESVIYVAGQHKRLDTKYTIKMFITGDKFDYDAATMAYLGNCMGQGDCYHFYLMVGEAA